MVADAEMTFDAPAPTMKVLSVDDTPANLLAVAAILEPLGCEVVEARSGPEAIERAAKQEFAAILLDVMMPGMDGFETLSRLRATPRGRQTPVLLLTAFDLDIREIERAYELGAIDYVPKPVPPGVLRGKVAAFLDLHRASWELHRRTAALVAKDRHIAVLAHDLRNPLSTIRVGAELVGRASDEPKIKSTADRVARAAQRMDDMIRDLLDFARVGAAAIPILPVVMDAGELCRELVEEFELADPKRRIELGCRGGLGCRWDRARIYQALSNLVGNATHYGGGRAQIEVAAEADQLVVRVHNDGPPIPPDLLPLIFEPFERGSQDGSGLGLGLYIVRQIARGHGGDVAVTSSAATGTTFVLRLPREAVTSAG